MVLSEITEAPNVVRPFYFIRRLDPRSPSVRMAQYNLASPTMAEYNLNFRIVMFY